MNRIAETSKRLTVHVNEQPVDVTVDSTVAALIESLALRGGPVAVELNQKLIPADQHQSTKLRQGDLLEIVSLTGGG